MGVLVIGLHFPDAGSLKAKRKELASIRSILHVRFGATVAEVDHQDLWQRSTLLAAVTSPTERVLDASVQRIERWLIDRCPSGVDIVRYDASLEDVRDTYVSRGLIGG